MISEAKPKIANYHFTTLSPVLGVVKIDEETSFVVADIPGLIEGASEGVGLGHEFLRHVDRCRLILHVVDVSEIEGRKAIEDFNKINEELKKFDENIYRKQQIVVANKCDIADKENIESFERYVTDLGYEFYKISAASSQGVKELVQHTAQILAELPPIKEYEPELIIEQDVRPNIVKEFNIFKDGDVYVVEADWLFNILNAADLEDYESLHYFQRVIKTSGIDDRLQSMGIKDGDTVKIFNLEFEYLR